MIGITLGDPGGIGPEVLLKSLQLDWSANQILLFGSFRVLQHHSGVLRIPIDFAKLTMIDVDNVPAPYFGAQPETSGRASMEYLEQAFQYFFEGKIDALVTGPIQKESWYRSGFAYPGQTEFCAERTGAAEYCMLMVGEKLKIAVLSTHVSLQKAVMEVRREAIVRKVRLIYREFQELGFPQPRIACAALNPHAGESGAFGSEEQREIEPALEELRREGIEVQGPFAPEVVFRMAVELGTWDVIVAMYHDQAMIPLKLLDFDQSANVTLGLPLIRTSPDHGTAFDIAGRGVARPGSMIYAMKLAADWTRRKKQ